MNKPLTAQELTYLRAIADGGGRKFAAKRLGVSEHRVKDISVIARFKLGAETSAQAAVIATQRGLL